MPLLSVNIDHVATLRQARYRVPAHAGNAAHHDFGEPDILRAFHEAELGGADGITVHLREDRRHVTDRDAHMLRELVRVRFNFEMAATDEMVAIAAKVRPHSAMLVPEGRNEVTTEGGLDVASQQARLKDVVKRLRDAGALVSAFIDADVKQVDAAKACGFDICEIHTGPYAHACLMHGREGMLAQDRELDRVRHAVLAVKHAGMQPNAGHALSYSNVGAIAGLESVHELHIGHAIISRAIYVGLRQATREMKEAIAIAARSASEE